MYNKWNQALVQCMGFFNASIVALQHQDREGTAEKVELLQMLRDRIWRNFGILSAVASYRVTRGDVVRMDRRAMVGAGGWKRQVVLRRELRVGEDLTGATELPKFVKDGANDKGRGKQTVAQTMSMVKADQSTDYWDIKWPIPQLP